MKKKQITITIIAAILIAYIAAVIIIDPYNYFNTRIVNQDVKTRIAYPLNERLSKIVEYKHNLSPNILIGDSRIQNLSVENIKKSTNDTYFNFGYGGCTLPELMDSFWFAAKQQKLKNVCVGISFDMYNKYNNTNLFKNALKSSTLFNYIFNGTNFKVIYYLIKDSFSKDKIVLGIPKVKDRDLFWQEKVDEQTQKFYKGYKYPEDFNKELKEIQEYCDKNGINLFFFIPPTYIDLQNKISEFSLVEEHERFLGDIDSIGKLYDFNIDNEFTRNKDNFFDPFHSRRDLDTILINVMFKNPSFTLPTTLISEKHK
jgi:hypothetical protein